MQFALIADTFPPLRTSGAVQLRDLSHEFIYQGHEIVVILPSASMNHSWSLEVMEGVQVLRLRAPKTKDVNYVRRTLAEFFMPFFMGRNLQKSPFAKKRFDGVVWYSPSIFHGPLVHAIKLASNCKSYLIIRDIFPQWAVDMGLMSKRGLPCLLFNTVAHYQYSVADIIGVQTAGNLNYFNDWSKVLGRRLEVLQNWLFDAPVASCSISVCKTRLAGRKIFVYAGNIGVAQRVDCFLDLAETLRYREDIGFLFVGRGRDAERLAANASGRQLNNVLFQDEIHPDEIPGLYSQCAVGLVALDPRHQSHNIPGKFLTYMQCGLPVLACINSGNDLVSIIQDNDVGRVFLSEDQGSLSELAIDIINSIENGKDFRVRCRELYLRLFSPAMAVKQIVSALTNTS